jgi:hypothetical protein
MKREERSGETEKSEEGNDYNRSLFGVQQISSLMSHHSNLITHVSYLLSHVFSLALKSKKESKISNNINT